MKLNLAYFILILLSIDSMRGQIQTVENRFVDCAPGSLKFYSVTPRGSNLWNFGPLGSFNTDTVTMVFTTTGSFTVTLGSYSQVVTIVDKPKVSIDSLSSRQGWCPSPSLHAWARPNRHLRGAPGASLCRWNRCDPKWRLPIPNRRTRRPATVLLLGEACLFSGQPP